MSSTSQEVPAAVSPQDKDFGEDDTTKQYTSGGKKTLQFWLIFGEYLGLGASYGSYLLPEPLKRPTYRILSSEPSIELSSLTVVFLSCFAEQLERLWLSSFPLWSLHQ